MQLTRRLLEAAVDVLAEEGWSVLSADRLVARTRSGKAGVYRRWPHLIALTVDAVGTLQLLDPLPGEDGLLAEIIAHHQPLTRPLSRDARALASLLGAVHQHPALAEAMHAALWMPLRRDLAALLHRHATRATPDNVAPTASTGACTDASAQALAGLDRLTGASTSLWCRYLVLGTPFSAIELEQTLSSQLAVEPSPSAPFPTSGCRQHDRLPRALTP